MSLKKPEDIKNLGGRDLAGFQDAWALGAQGEEIAIRALRARGYQVVRASTEEDILQDIDIYLDGLPTSIKRQEAGVRFRNYGFELEAQETGTGRWRESWFYTGKADQYLILQGDRLALIKKDRVKEYVSNGPGWLRTRTLSPAVKATQGGSYRFSDARSGYLDWGTVEEAIWTLKPEEVSLV